MKSRLYILAALVLAQAPIIAQEQADTKEQLSRIERLYRTFKQDVAKVKKCYISREKCSEQEISQARWSAARLGAELIAAIGISYGVKSLIALPGQKYKEYRKQRARQQETELDDISFDELKTDLFETLEDVLDNFSKDKLIKDYTIAIPGQSDSDDEGSDNDLSDDQIVILDLISIGQLKNVEISIALDKFAEQQDKDRAIAEIKLAINKALNELKALLLDRVKLEKSYYIAKAVLDKSNILSSYSIIGFRNSDEIIKTEANVSGHKHSFTLSIDPKKDLTLKIILYVGNSVPNPTDRSQELEKAIRESISKN